MPVSQAARVKGNSDSMTVFTERPRSHQIKFGSKEKHSHTMSVRAGSSSRGVKQPQSYGIEQSFKEVPTFSVKNSGGQESFRIKMNVADEGKSKTTNNPAQISIKKKGAISKVNAEEEVTQNLMERIKTKIKAMNMLISEGKAQNFTDFDSISVASERNINFKFTKNPNISRSSLSDKEFSPVSMIKTYEKKRTSPDIKTKDIMGSQYEINLDDTIKVKSRRDLYRRII